MRNSNLDHRRAATAVLAVLLSTPSLGLGAAALPATASAQTASVSNYDFEPGERTLFQSDFSVDELGDFPRGLELIQGNMQVVEWEGRRMLQGDSRYCRFAVVLPETLPEQFTIEFEAYEPRASVGVSVALSEPPNWGWAWAHGYDHHYFKAGDNHGSGIWGARGSKVSTTDSTLMDEGLSPVRIMVDGEHAKMFIGEERVANLPRADLPRGDRLYFFFDPVPPDEPVYITNIRVAAGGKDLYEALTTDGRVEIHDILFDTGSATIRAESAPILEEIGTMLQEHAELSLLIEGHTDDQGDFDMNMQLSADRAASVKAWLVERSGIDASRLRTMGLGPSRPVGSNDTAAGRQKNRRVELVRMQ